MTESRLGLAEALLILATVIIALAFTANVLHLSAYGGRLAFPPQYDDVAYLLSGFDLFETSLKRPLVFLVGPLIHHHAPIQSLLAFAGYRLFGINEWSAYQVNGILFTMFVLAVLWMTRPLGTVSRLSIVLIVLATPFASNLVTEFRPDLFWGLLCGFAVLLLLHPQLLDRGWTLRIGALFLGVTALHAKPSASPATALLLAVALSLGIALKLKYQPLWPGEIKLRLVVPLAVGVLASAPFFAVNGRTLYDYMQVAFVTWRDVNQFQGSWLAHATYYSTGICYRAALFGTLWIGLAALSLQAYWLRVRRLKQDLAYHLALVTVVVLAYAIPTLSGVKSYYLGGIFYGTFLVATIATLVELFRLLEEHRDHPAYHARWVLPALAGGILITAPAVPFIHPWNPRLAADRRAAYHQMVSSIVRDASQRHPTASVTGDSTSPRPPQPVTVYTASPAVMTASSISLFARWHGTPTVGTQGYYTRTIPALQGEARQSDYVVLSEFHDSLYPGSILSPDLLESIKSDPDFHVISIFRHADGSQTYLFRHRRAEPGSQD